MKRFNGDAQIAVDADDRPTRSGSLRERRSSAVYDQLLWRLQSAMTDDAATGFVLGLIGAAPKSGTTTIAANLALRAAEQEWGRVLLVETDWHAPRIAKQWRLPAQPGAAQALCTAAAMEECVHPGPVDGLFVLPAGVLPRRQQPRVDPHAATDLLKEARADFRLIVVDLPAATVLRQELAIARQLDQALLVVRAESSRQTDCRRSVRQLQQDGVPVSGAILNRQRTYLPAWLRNRI